MSSPLSLLVAVYFHFCRRASCLQPCARASSRLFIFFSAAASEQAACFTPKICFRSIVFPSFASPKSLSWPLRLLQRTIAAENSTRFVFLPVFFFFSCFVLLLLSPLMYLYARDFACDRLFVRHLLVFFGLHANKFPDCDRSTLAIFRLHAIAAATRNRRMNSRRKIDARRILFFAYERFVAAFLAVCACNRCARQSRSRAIGFRVLERVNWQIGARTQMSVHKRSQSPRSASLVAL